MQLPRRGRRNAAAVAGDDHGPIIRADSVVKTYRTGSAEVNALRNVSFAVARG